MIALIDADSLLYKAGFSYEEKINWNELEQEINVEKESSISITSNIVEAKNAIDGLIENIMFKTGCEDYELWLSGKDNFRYEVLDTYKHNRKDSRKPQGFTELWNYLLTKYKAKVAEGYEADDIVVMKKTTQPEDYFLCAIDKDVLLQTEGTHYNYGKDEFIEVTKQEAIRFFYEQVLTGDTVDGYKGCPNIGKVKAKKLLDLAEQYYNNALKDVTNINLESYYWNIIVDTYSEKGIDIPEILQQCRVANMHQLEAVKKDSKSYIIVNLWEPPTTKTK